MKLVAYADESGTHDKTGRKKGSGEAVVGGMVATVEDWAKFCGDWQTVLNKYHASYFHFKEWSSASAIKRGVIKPYKEYEKNPFKGWEVGRLDDFLIELAKVAGDGKKVVFGGYVNTKKFYESKARGEILIGQDPYKFCLIKCFEEFVYQIDRSWPNFKEPVSLFFDWTDDPLWKHAILEGFDLFKRKDSRFSEIAFADKKKPPHLPLQAADMLAYRMRQITENYVAKKLPKKTSAALDYALFKEPFSYFDSHKEEAFKHLLKGNITQKNDIFFSSDFFISPLTSALTDRGVTILGLTFKDHFSLPVQRELSIRELLNPKTM